MIALLIALSTASLAQQAKPRTLHERLSSTREFARYVGTYPCSNGLLAQPVLLSSLRNILGDDYLPYREHMKYSGCGAIEKRGELLLMDVSQLHVGGYTSFIFIRLRDGAVFLFWLKSQVAEKQWQFYGPKPLPAAVFQITAIELNTIWGHVAKFTIEGQQLQIDLDHPRQIIPASQVK